MFIVMAIVSLNIEQPHRLSYVPEVSLQSVVAIEVLLCGGIALGRFVFIPTFFFNGF